MPKPSCPPTDTPQAILAAMHARYGSWAWVSVKVNDISGTRFDRALLSRVARGKQNAPNSLRAALGFPAHVTVEACACGEVHQSKRCPNKRKAPKPRTGPTPKQKRLLAMLGALWAR